MADNKTNRIGVIGVVLVALSVALLGCQSQPAAPAAPAQAPAAQPAPASQAAAPATQTPAKPTAAPETLKFGILTSLTGTSARTGLNIDRFIRMAVEDINAKGGLQVAGKTYRLEAVTVDDKSTAEGGVEAAKRLALAEKVKFLGGALGSGTAGAQTVTEPGGILNLSYSAPEAALGPKFPLTFLSSPHPAMRIGVIYDWLLKDQPNVKNVALIYSDDSAARGTTPVIKRIAGGKGFNFVGEEYYPMDLKDFVPLMTRVLRTNPQGIDGAIAGRGGPMLAISRILRDQGWKGPYYGTGADISAVKEGLAFMEGLTIPVMADIRSDIVTKTERDILQRYVARYPEADLEPAMLVTYNGILVLTQAIQKAGTVDDAVKVAQVLREGEWDTMWSEKLGKVKFVGAQTFGLPVTMEQQIYLSGVRNGKLVTFDTIKGTLP